MRKRFTRILAALALLVFMMPSMAGWGQTRTDQTITLTYDSFGLTTSYAVKTATVDGYSFTVDKGYKGTGNVIQMNSSQGKGILYNTTPITGLKSIKVNVSSGNKTYTITTGTSQEPTSNSQTGTTGGTYNAASGDTYFQLKVSGASYFSSIEITYETGSSSSVTAPEISPASCTFTTTQDVTITPASGTTVYYTIDGTTPDNTKIQYTEPFSVSATTTVKAIAYDGDDNASDVVSETYTKVTITNIEDITEAGEYTVQGTVVAKNAKGLVLGDGTGYIYYYLTAEPSYALNSNLIISGAVSSSGYNNYDKILQFTNTATVGPASSSNYNAETATATEIEEIPFLGNNDGLHLSDYYQFDGTLVFDGYYYVEFGDYSRVYLAYHTTAQNTTLSNLKNKPVRVKGYFAGISSKYYFSVMYATIEEIDGSTLPEYEWVPASISSLTSSDIFVIVGKNSDKYYSLFNAGGTSNSPTATEKTIDADNGITSYVSHTEEWRIGGNATDGYTFYSNDGTSRNWLYVNTTATSGSNDKLRVGTGNRKLFVADGTTYKTKDNYTARYLNVYISGNTKEWRDYLSNSTSTEVTFYKRQLITSDPTLTVSTNTINDFSYTVGGGPSAVQSFSVGGRNLGTDQVSIALGENSNFEMALDQNAETWSSLLALDPTEGSLSNITVYVRMKAGLDEGDYSDEVSVTWETDEGSLSETVSLSGTVNPVPVTYTYVLATSIEPGKHYLFTNGYTGSVKVMGYQNTNNRPAATGELTIDDNGKISVTSDVINTQGNVFEFVISGNGTDPNYYTIYDETNSGYLYAAGSGSGKNHLKNQPTNDANGLWTIDIDSDSKVATIEAQGTNTNNVMQYNSSSSLFSCYGSASQSEVYLFKKENDTDLIYYSPTTYSGTSIEGTVTVGTGSVMTVPAGFTNNDPDKLIIEDGGQLITSNAVAATVKKNVEKANNWGAGEYTPDGWYFIALPLNSDEVTPSMLTTGDYDLYHLNPGTATWENYKTHDGNDNPGFTLANGEAYLYANNAGLTVDFAGTVKASAASQNVGVSAGWNLVGNPFTYNTYLNRPYYKLNDDRNDIEIVNNNAAIAPCTGVLVKITTEENVTFTKTDQSVGANNGNINIALAQTHTTRGVESMATLDKAILSFNEGSELGKFYFGTQNANIYIPQDGEQYAIVSTEPRGEMPVCFKAAQDGQYTITVNPEEVEMGYLHLIDNIAGQDIDLLATPSYTFSARTDDYESRFRLVFSTTMVNAEMGEDFAFMSDGQLVIANEGEATLQVIDVTGRVVATENINGTCSMAINAKAGVYVLRLVNGTDVKTQKMVIR